MKLLGPFLWMLLASPSLAGTDDAFSEGLARTVYVLKAGEYRCLGARLDDTRVLTLKSCVVGSAGLHVATGPGEPLVAAAFDRAPKTGDLARIRAPLPGTRTPLAMGDTVKVGQEVQSVTLSDASGEDRFIVVRGKVTGVDAGRIDTDIRYGHRGSPLFDMRGRLIGIGNIDIGDRSFARVTSQKLADGERDWETKRQAIFQILFAPYLEWAKIPKTTKQGPDIGLDIGFRYNDTYSIVLPTTFLDPTWGIQARYRRIMMPETVDQDPLRFQFHVGVRRLEFAREGDQDDEKSRFVPELGFGIGRGWWGLGLSVFPAQKGYSLRYP